MSQTKEKSRVYLSGMGMVTLLGQYTDADGVLRYRIRVGRKVTSVPASWLS
jgi:hypothetical protein